MVCRCSIIIFFFIAVGMKLTKNKLLKITKEVLMKLGYQEIKDTQTGANGLFAKLLEDNYFLTLGLVLSNYFDTRFTASYYLSKTTRWGSMWGDIPRESYKRIGSFLTKEERQLLLNEEHKKVGVTDAWLDSNDEAQTSIFAKTIELTEKRFLTQDQLFHKIEKSSDVSELANYSMGVITLITQSKKTDRFDFRFLKP
jgi:hypothetical protein